MSTIRPIQSTDALPPKSMSRWMFASAGLVFGVIVVGGLTRLTESGLSITEWKPVTGSLLPIGTQWDAEYAKYLHSPEGKLRAMSFAEFKTIFYWEWAHRNLGRLVGLAVVLPSIYYATRYNLGRRLRLKLLGFSGLIGVQGALGWFMVKSGLEETSDVPRVSQYRLAAHLSAALILFSSLLWNGLEQVKDRRFIDGKLGSAGDVLKRYTHVHVLKTHRATGILLSLVALTIVSGAFVAGLDAGLIYNSFPYMGETIVPNSHELFNPAYAQQGMWRNLFENPTTVHFNHRLLGISTWLFTTSLMLASRRLILPKAARSMMMGTWGVVTLQAVLGISTLLTGVSIPIAALHQANAVVLLAHVLSLSSALRRPSMLNVLSGKLSPSIQKSLNPTRSILT